GGDADADGDSTRNADGYTEGIPGPVTRLVVLANRGLANLVQDLILRVAATSEKFVNFKAKLITALI
ncbi:GM18829, partial [Drosophila sechellia]